MWEGAKGYCIGRSERKKQRARRESKWEKKSKEYRTERSKEQKDLNRNISSSSLKNSTQAY